MEPLPLTGTKRTLRSQTLKADGETNSEQASQPFSNRKRTRSMVKMEDAALMSALKESKASAREIGAYVTPSPQGPQPQPPTPSSTAALKSVGAPRLTRARAKASSPDVIFEDNAPITKVKGKFFALLANEDKSAKHTGVVTSKDISVGKATGSAVHGQGAVKFKAEGHNSEVEARGNVSVAKSKSIASVTRATADQPRKFVPAISAYKVSRARGLVPPPAAVPTKTRHSKGTTHFQIETKTGVSHTSRFPALEKAAKIKVDKNMQAQIRMHIKSSAFLARETKLYAIYDQKDHLVKTPVEKHAYLDKKDELLLGCHDTPYTPAPAKTRATHPKIRYAEKRGILTPNMVDWYQNMSLNRNIPVAGVPSDKPHRCSKGERKIAEERKNAENRPSGTYSRPWHVVSNVFSLHFGPEQPFVLSITNFQEQEEAFHSRPSIKIIIPDMLKGLLVDDWENITKNNQLVPLPHPHPVSKVLADYIENERPKRPEGSASIDILDETVAGLKEYFDKCLGRILLYRFERAQYAEIREKWQSGGPEWQGKAPCETYGSEHLLRLMVSLPELIAQTNMDQQSVNRLREELSKLCLWLEKNAGDYFTNDYEVPNAEYTEKAKN